MKPLGYKGVHFIVMYHLCFILYIVDKSTIDHSQLPLMLHKKVGFMNPLTQLNGPIVEHKLNINLQLTCAVSLNVLHKVNHNTLGIHTEQSVSQILSYETISIKNKPI